MISPELENIPCVAVTEKLLGELTTIRLVRKTCKFKTCKLAPWHSPDSDLVKLRDLAKHIINIIARLRITSTCNMFLVNQIGKVEVLLRIRQECSLKMKTVSVCWLLAG